MGFFRRSVLVVVLTALRAAAADPQPSSQPAPQPAPQEPVRQEPVIGWEQAGDHMNEEVVVEGRVVGVHCSQLSCLLAFEPTFNKFTAVVQAHDFDKFPPAELKQRYEGHQVRVRGKIIDRDKKPEIVVDTPDALVLAEAKKTASSGEESPSDRVLGAQVEAIERMTDVLERIEDLTERLADVQARMETVLANLEQRDAALAQAVAPPPPTSGPPPPPAFESLRTVKRGMTRADVERLVGPPAYVEQASNGWSTWYYQGDRSISFDQRGRAQSLTGFSQ